MERSSICPICGGVAKRAYTCQLCGATVCSSCFNQNLGLCKRCAAKVKPRRF